jgi:hypothetical protein
MNELAKSEPAPLAQSEPTLAVSDDIVVLARDPNEMAEAQKGLILWMDRKLASLNAELAEAEENLATAKRMKVRTQGWQRIVKLAKNRITYYGKARSALEEGYCIIPDFPVQLVAVKTTKKWPPKKWRGGGGHMVPDVVSEPLPDGEGRYVSPDPTVTTRDLPRKPDETWTRVESRAVDFRDVDFPFKVVKPQILKGLETAMKRKLFDEIGVLPAARKGGDPVLVGRIKRKEGTYHEPSLTFLIAWWIDTSDL